jgi:hypothetical protein
LTGANNVFARAPGEADTDRLTKRLKEIAD